MFFNIFEQILLVSHLFTYEPENINETNYNFSANNLIFSPFGTDLEVNQEELKPQPEQNFSQQLYSTSFPKCCNFYPGSDVYSNCNHSYSDKLFHEDGDSYATEEMEQKLFRPFVPTYQDNITFEVSLPKCTKGHKFMKVYRNTAGGIDKDLGNQGRFLHNGYFGHHNEYYSSQEYCINGLTGEFVEVKICEPECSKERPCIQKCCDPDEIYSFSRRQCIKSNPVLYNPIFYHDMSNRLNKLEQKRVHPHFTIRFPRSFKYHCQENTTQIFPSGNLFAEYLSNSTGRKYYPAEFRLRKDGTILYRKDGRAIVLPDGHPIFLRENNRKCYRFKTEHYCLDGATEYGSPDGFTNDEGETFLVTCSEYLYETPVIGPLSFVYGNVMIGSSFFSLLTVLVYLILKEKRNIHGVTVVSYATSMFFMYVFLGLAHLIRYYGSDQVLKTKSCVLIGIASHLFSLSSFLWLTMMNWDLWWTFRKIRPAIKSDRDPKLWRHYLKYSIFGWGIPLMIISVSSYLHFNYEEAAEDDCAETGFPLPAYGRESCEIKQLSLGVYLYFPATVLLLCNLLFFIVTTYSLCKHERMTLIAVKRLERHHQSLTLFGKLFFVMGVTRVFEVVTWAESGPNLTWYWAVFDIFNVLQAVAIFIIYVCKRDIMRSLKNKFASLSPDCLKLKTKGYDGKSLSTRRK